MPTRTQQIRRIAAVPSALAVLVAASACSPDGGGGAAADYPSKTVEIMVPSGAGGGWDSTARAMQSVIQSEKVTDESVEVFNVEGGGGATGLSQFQDSKGDPHQLMMTGLVMIGALKQANSPVSLKDTTPIATLTGEAEAFVVPKDSKYHSIKQIIQDYKKNPKSVAFGGGSAGGSDELVIAELLKKAGADASTMKYVGYPGGGEATAGILSGDVEVGVSGYSEFESQISSGKMRLLAISTADTFKVNGKPAPTLKDAGYDVDFSNWRAIVAAPGISDEQKKAVTQLVTKMHDTKAWSKQLKKNHWSDFFKSGKAAQKFFTSETKRVNGLYKDLGL